MSGLLATTSTGPNACWVNIWGTDVCKAGRLLEHLNFLLQARRHPALPRAAKAPESCRGPQSGEEDPEVRALARPWGSAESLPTQKTRVSGLMAPRGSFGSEKPQAEGQCLDPQPSVG